LEIMVMVEVALEPWAAVTLVALRVKAPLEVVVLEPSIETTAEPVEPAKLESPE
jgi:hypothetical protein